MKISKSIILTLFMSTMILSLSSCSMFKKRKCNKCPKFTEVEKLENESLVRIENEECPDL